MRESKYKVGDVVKVYDSDRNTTISEVVYDLDKHQPDTHMYITQGGGNLAGLWFEEELCLTIEASKT